MTKKPPVERPGVLRFNRAQAAIVRRETVKRVYYLCGEAELLHRVPNTVHREIVSGRVAIPQFANCRLRMVEVLVSSGLEPKIVKATGSYYSFGADGRLDLHPFAEVIARVLEGDKPQLIQDNVVDIGPVIRSRRWDVEQTWKPSSKLLIALHNEMQPASSGLKRVPLLRPLNVISVNNGH